MPTENGFSTAMKMVSGKWKIDILCELGAASRRFGRLRQSIPAISEKMLTQHLRELEADGLVNRTVYPGSSMKVVYSLTESGVALNAGAEGLCRWGEQFPSVPALKELDNIGQPSSCSAREPSR